MRKIIIFSIAVLSFVSIDGTRLLYAQTIDYGDDKIDLWENERQRTRQGDFEKYYVPNQDFPGSKPYITEEELRKLYQPEIVDEEKTEMIKPEARAAYTKEYKSRYLSAYYLANITYGIATGALMGGVAAIITNESARKNLSYLGIGVVLGGLFGFGVASMYEPNLGLDRLILGQDKKPYETNEIFSLWNNKF